MIPCARARLCLLWLCVVTLGLPVFAQSGSADKTPHPWMNPSLSPDERAAMVVKEMTLDEKISLLHGTGMSGLGPVSPLAVHSNAGAGYVIAIPLLGIPAIQIPHAPYGARMRPDNVPHSRHPP